MSDVLYRKLHSLSLCICTCHLQPVCYCCISTGICLVLHCISDTFNNVHDILINSCTISDHSEIKKGLAIINSVKLSVVPCMHGSHIICMVGVYCVFGGIISVLSCCIHISSSEYTCTATLPSLRPE